MRIQFLITFIALLPAYRLQAQNTADTALHKPAKDAMLGESYSGFISFRGNVNHIVITLQHRLNRDMGRFTLSETIEGSAKKPTEISGKWTVIRGSATDHNAKVVKLSAPAKTLYYLRLKGGDLQQLDDQLNEMKPAVNYLYRKQ